MAITVRADVKDGEQAVSVTQELRPLLKDIEAKLPAGYRVDVAAAQLVAGDELAGVREAGQVCGLAPVVDLQILRNLGAGQQCSLLGRELFGRRWRRHWVRHLLKVQRVQILLCQHRGHTAIWKVHADLVVREGRFRALDAVLHGWSLRDGAGTGARVQPCDV